MKSKIRVSLIGLLFFGLFYGEINAQKKTTAPKFTPATPTNLCPKASIVSVEFFTPNEIGEVKNCLLDSYQSIQDGSGIESFSSGLFGSDGGAGDATKGRRMYVPFFVQVVCHNNGVSRLFIDNKVGTNTYRAKFEVKFYYYFTPPQSSPNTFPKPIKKYFKTFVPDSPYLPLQLEPGESKTICLGFVHQLYETETLPFKKLYAEVILRPSDKYMECSEPISGTATKNYD